MKTTEFWSGAGGASYTERNRVDWRARIPFWRDAIPADAGSALEVGCNAGWNLRAIQVCRNVLVDGFEVNEGAAQQARARTGSRIYHGDYSASVGVATHDLVFTAGVLIHIASHRLDFFMEKIAAQSRRYVMSIEYEADQEEEVRYQGEYGLLWRRPYGQMYQSLGLSEVWRKDAGPGFDRCQAVLLSKG